MVLILGHETYLNQFKTIEIIQCLLLAHNGIKLEVNNREIAGKFEKYLEAKLHPLNNT